MSHVRNWIPYKLVKTGNEQHCHWLNTHCLPFKEPFFEDTIRSLKSNNINYAKYRSVSSLNLINEWADGITYLKPTAIIFHISRCGSTLATQMLASADENIVLSEVPFIDDMIRLTHDHTVFDTQAGDTFLKSAIKFYSQQKIECEKHLFIKTDSWHVFFYERLRAMFPDTPFILMYRNPCEVFWSHKKKAGMHTVKGYIENALPGFKVGGTDEMVPDEYLSRVLENYLEKYLEIAGDDNSLLINYGQSPKNMLRRIIDFSGVTYSKGQLQKMDGRSFYHSKNNENVFVKDEPGDVPAHLEKAMDLYHRLTEKHSGPVR